MARQKGLFTISGTIGDVNYFVTHGIGYTRQAGGGFNGEAIKNKASMQPVRENGSEFGNCSRIKKQFQLALAPFFSGIKGRDFHSKMMGLFLKIKALDTVSERGKRCVKTGLQTQNGKQALKHFAFTPKNPVLNTLTASASFNWQTQQASISQFNPQAFKAPKSATHIGITLGVLDFDFHTLASTLCLSPTLFLAINTVACSHTLIPDTVVQPLHFGIAMIGVRYYTILDHEVYAIPVCIGAGILDCLG